jgi:hypothetical protein
MPGPSRAAHEPAAGETMGSAWAIPGSTGTDHDLQTDAAERVAASIFSAS